MQTCNGRRQIPHALVTARAYAAGGSTGDPSTTQWKKVVTMTNGAVSRESIVAYAVPVSVLLASVVTALFVPNRSQIAVVVVALGVGMLARPRSIAIVWTA